MDKEIERYNDIDDIEDDLDPNFLLIDLFVNDSGLQMFRSMTLFSCVEFERIWDKIGIKFCSEWGRGCGP